MNDLTARFHKPTKVNEGLPRIGMLVSVDNLPEMGVDSISAIDYEGKEIIVELKQNKEHAFWNNCTTITEAKRFQCCMGFDDCNERGYCNGDC